MENDWQDDFYRYKLKKNRVALVRDMIPDLLVDHLLAEDVISEEEYEMVMYCNQTRAGRNRKLLDILVTKGPNGFNEFRNVLVNDFGWLAELLDNTQRPAQPPPQQTEKESKSIMVPDSSQVLDEDIENIVRSYLSTGSPMAWKFLARKLGVTEDKICEIEYRSPRDLRAQIYEMLLFWRLENSHRATVDWLCKALNDEGRVATAEVISANHKG